MKTTALLKQILFVFVCLFFASDARAYYDAERGQWLSRDPIGENGGVNLYGFVGNQPVCNIDFLGMSCGTNLTRAEAGELACAINDWLKDAKAFNAVFYWGSSDRSITLGMLKHYMSKSQSTYTVPESALLKDASIQNANADARRHFANGSNQQFIRQGITTAGDLGTAINRTSARYTKEFFQSTNGILTSFRPSGSYWMIRGELWGEKYTFLDTNPGDKIGVPFPMFQYASRKCCWKCGDEITDIWMADLERFGHAKSFDVQGSWTVNP